MRCGQLCKMPQAPRVQKAQTRKPNRRNPFAQNASRGEKKKSVRVRRRVPIVPTRLTELRQGLPTNRR